jgi:carbonic anhydrase
MSTIDQALRANQRYAQAFPLGHLPIPPARRLAVVTCMDARLDVETTLGLVPGDAHIIRNAGGIVTDDVLRSLAVSHHILGTQEVMIINHTNCGMAAFSDEELRAQIEQISGASTDIPATFHCFTDLEDNLRRQIARVKAHPWLCDCTAVRGFIYDVTTGNLNEITEK